MAATCPAGFDVGRLQTQIRDTYERVAQDPSGTFHFHRGAAYACQDLGYDVEELAALPRTATDAFAGVGNPHRTGPILAGETVLDHACGAGMDLLLAARRAGPGGTAIGIDMTPGMVARARRAALEARLAARVSIREGAYEALPVESASVDVVLSNGVVNLAPDKRQVFHEIARILHPGGRLYLADVVLQRELAPNARENPDLWAACIAGALPERELLSLLSEAGFVHVAIVERYDCFRGTSAEHKVSADLCVGAVTLFAEKP